MTLSTGIQPMMKAFLKAVLPPSLVKVVGGLRAERRQKYLSTLPPAEAFNEIYRRKMWQQSTSLSGPGSSGVWAVEFQKLAARFVKDRDVKSVLDIGCGDFSVGSYLAPMVQSMTAMDISDYIVEKNRSNYGYLKNVSFLVGDVCEGRLPPFDLVLVRQVLQHLTNSQIEKALTNIEESGAKYALIAEQIIRPDLLPEANLDIPSHSVRTRVDLGSGVIITSPPFSRQARLLQLVEPDASNLAEPNSVLAIFLAEF